MEWLAEGFGAAALVVNFIGYRQNTADRYRIVAALALALLSTHWFLLDAMAAGIVCAIASVRNIVALRYHGRWTLAAFVLLNVGFFIWEWRVYGADLPLFIAYASAFVFTVGSIVLNNATQIRRWFIVAESLGLIYALLIGSVSGSLFNIVNLTSILTKLWQERGFKRN
ncbi:hypothetical protein CWI84_00115 [Idiomarina tyrosinivorans]|uniref:YgjV family protein n=1 Tax=Idiomarina tyrosinivorans TaxID=1445662 RepID=A0A432ZTG9_9GAMM|nr:YgjV family protein [Idiomarina tyrosinivorans]RUO81210.1 hypothetical protein CWI84_00115 [Idiomarina tyrosinivorans]